MQRDLTAILDFGSLNLTFCLGKRGVNGTFILQCLNQIEYSGYSDGEFIEPEALFESVEKAILSGKNSKMKVKNLVIGVPAEFCLVNCTEVSKNFTRKVKLTDEVIQELSELAIDVEMLQTKTLISCKPLWVKLDDNRKLFNFKGEKTSRVVAEISSIYVDNSFIELVNEMLTKLEIESVEYISSNEAQAKYLLSNEDKSQDSLIVDVGYLSTSVMHVCGNGIYNLKAFSLGGGHVSADLAECLKISFEQGEALKREIVLSIKSKRMEDCYEVDVKDKILPVSINIANEIVSARLDMICLLIKKIFASFGIENSQFVPVYLTGGGISYIKGARDYLAKSLGRNVQSLVPLSPGFAKPHLSSVISVLNLALENKQNNSLLKIFN